MLTTREVILAKIETTAGQDPGAAVSANEIFVEEPSWANEGASMIARSAVKNTLGKKQDIYGGSLKTISFATEIKGSGAAGTAPEIGPLLRACSLGETIVSSTSVTYAPISSGNEYISIYYYQDGMLRKVHGCQGKVTFNMEAGNKMMANFTFTGHQMSYGTAQAGASTTITLVGTASAVDDTYNGQTIEIIAGTGAGQSKTISDYVGSTKVATVSTWTTTPDNTSVYKISGGPIDVALPTPSYDSTVPEALLGVPVTIGSYAAAISKLELSLGNEVSMPKNIASPDGFGVLTIIGRDIAGSFDPLATLVATKDWENEWEAGEQQAIDTDVIGTTAGNRIQLQVPYAYYRDIGPGDREGNRTYEIPFGATESSGDDEISLAFT